MDRTTEAASGGSETTPIVIAPAPAGNKPVDARQAARDLATWRYKRDKQQEGQQQAGELRHIEASTQQTPQETAEASAKAGAGEREALPRETENADREGDLSAEALTKAELPSSEPPRSWTKEDKELFASLPRATQERIAERERSREGDFSRRQQEATEQRNALAAERQMLEQTRQRYEAALPQLVDTLQQQHATEFADVKTIADVERLAREDWPRYQRWELQQKKIAEAARELFGAQGRQISEQRQRFFEFAKRQGELLVEKVPDLADPDKAAKLQDAAILVLKDLGFENAELAALWSGQKELSLRDHRLQLLVRDGILWRDAQQKAKAASAKSVPPVQRPGVSQPRGAARDAQIQALSKRLEESGSLKDAAALLRARRAAR
jgi:hypothetical protein